MDRRGDGAPAGNGSGGAQPVPLEMLRAFMRHHVRRLRLQGVQDELVALDFVKRISKETIAKFVRRPDNASGRDRLTLLPHDRVLHAFERLLFHHHPSGFHIGPDGEPVPSLLTVLPADPAQAMALLDLARERLPAELHAWVEWNRVRYRAERGEYPPPSDPPPPRRKRRKKDPESDDAPPS